MISEESGGNIKNACFGGFSSSTFYKLNSGGIPIIVKDNLAIKSNIIVTIKNEAVLPFITNIAISNCKATDGTNIIPMEITEGYKFPKEALLPDKEAVVEINIYTYPGEKCIYNGAGVKKCERPLEKAKNIISCDFSIATDGSQITGGWGKFFQTLVF
jgi:hypothetical protein